ncbi:MAG: bacterial transcriptional activator domain-containing protein, partial [Anaerolineae bacterium]|nr:bacterial transcriptional activator domain-containing protein [Anaerolineae bacterium]
MPASVRLTILHPDFHGQHQLFAPVLNELGSRTVFLAIPEAGLGFNHLLELLQATIAQQLDTTLPDLPDDPVAAANVLVKTLNGYGKVSLILDAYDLIEQDSVNLFIATVAAQLPEGSRVVIGTRVLPMALVEHADLQGKTALVPVYPEKMVLDYTRSVGSDVLEVRALGPGRVLINGRLVTHWDGVLPRMLFYYFVDRGMTTRDEIFQTFWPNLSTREATNVFHVTKRKISEILGTDLTVYWSGFYRISPDLELHYDVIKFAEAVQNAAVAPDDEALVMLQNAVALYNGPYLSMVDQSWIMDRREELASNYAEALAGLARIHKVRDEKRDALGYFLRASAASPHREDLVRSIMELYRDLDRPEDALMVYERLEDELQAALNVSPGPQTRELA